jgi:RHS repeat-associated protein
MLSSSDPIQTSPSSSRSPSNESSISLQIPSINLPKGGGAIRGIGEKFSTNPVTGAGSISIPIAVSPGRSGLSPQLSLTYDSGSGNGPFGFGWSLGLPQITRKTDKGLPQYRDTEESDVFILSGAEDLVPALRQDDEGQWVRDEFSWNGYEIRRYRPRIEGLFALIERWSKSNDSADVHWRSISRDNILTLYGADENSRIFDPVNKKAIFSWLICETRDDKGNGIVYCYQEDDGHLVELGQAHERNRGNADDARRKVNRYIRSIKYGNQFTLLDSGGIRPHTLSPVVRANVNWMFNVVFDYDETQDEEISDGRVRVQSATAWEVANPQWKLRPDPFSNYRAGFELRTTRRCKRVLMFHQFPALEQSDDGYTGLVRSTDFTYMDGSSNENAPNTAIYSFIQSVRQSSYQLDSNDEYFRKSLPPIEFAYTLPIIQTELYELKAESLENLPIGIDGASYRWIDLDGEGLSGVLTEQAGAWFYKRNLSPINVLGEGENIQLEARFAPIEMIASKPAFALNQQTQFLDLSGDGRPELVQFNGATPGFYERTMDEGWDSFVAIPSLPKIDWNNPNLKFVDLNGDGRADILISDDKIFTWHPSLGEDGFGKAEHKAQAWDEENGPRIVFADGTQSIYLADMSGDGLSDIVRIRNGEVCYWPNLGYAQFGAKVTMDKSPWFDHPDLFDQKHIRLADIDGSGTSDIVYLGRHQIDIYFNQSGNSWADSYPLKIFPRSDNLVDVQVFDLLGNGTACLVWNSPLPNDTGRPMRYIKLMGEQKPHLLTSVKNNLGAETHIRYAPSTKFYLQDQLAGNAWITKLPFPIHCVEKLTVCDHWIQTEFTSTYSYHHGYFDGPEREFRGFGRVEQRDVEDYGKFIKANSSSPYITKDKTLYQAPIKTITWFHTGASLERQRILRQFEDEYFYKRYPQRSGFAEKPLPEPDFAEQDLSADEWREAMRACKGLILRQEIYELDIDALHEKQEEIPIRIFSAVSHNCHIQRLQRIGDNRHAVFLVTESEALSYTYELDLRGENLALDPRISHTLNLRHDQYGNSQQSITVNYPRIKPETDADFAEQLGLIRMVQSEMHTMYLETRYTDDVLIAVNPREPLLYHSLRLPCEVLTYELTGLQDPTVNTDPSNRYFTIEYLRKLKLSAKQGYEPLVPADEKAIDLNVLQYHQRPKDATPHQRLVENSRTLFFDDFDGTTPLKMPLSLGQLGIRRLKYEDYKLALTENLLDAIFREQSVSPVGGLPSDKLEWPTRNNETGYSRLINPTISGYLNLIGDSERASRAGITSADEYWICSGVAGFADDAAQAFYLPEEYRDSFGNLTKLSYDARSLYIQSSTDARGNTTKVVRFDYRVLAPREMEDLNGNLTEVLFDVLGMVVAIAEKGGGNTIPQDSRARILFANPPHAEIIPFFNTEKFEQAESQQAETWLGEATGRFVYYFGEARDDDGNFIQWMARPAGACGIQREEYQVSGKFQVALECSDGSGNVMMKKVQAEADEGKSELRWIVSGKRVLNNKAKTVLQYEPYFSDDFGCTELDEVGVTPIMYYDALGRLIRTEMPDGSYSRVEFSPWFMKSFDANDTVLEADNAWYAHNTAADASEAKRRAALLAAGHADTPSISIFDSLAREVIAIAHNKTTFSNGEKSETRYVTFTKLDAEGKALWIRDARGNLVMQYITPVKPTRAADERNPKKPEDLPSNSVPCYDIAGNLLYQHSMDAGERWMLMDAAGKPMLLWDMNERQIGDDAALERRLYFIEYDELHRPTGRWLSINGDPAQMVERFEYRDNDMAARQENLNGQLVKHYDPSGLTETIRRDFKGNLEEIHRRLNNAPKESLIDWADDNRETKLEDEVYIQIIAHDALNRMIRHENWHRIGTTGAIYVPSYNERGLLKSETLTLNGTPTAAIREIRYNEKGQKTYLRLGNDTITEYSYDSNTFRLLRLITRRSANSTHGADTVQDLAYTYDPVGNIVEIYDKAYEPVFFKNQKVEPRSLYNYDAVYRLIEAKGRENRSFTGAPPHHEDRADEFDFPILPTDPKALRNYIERYYYDEVGNFTQVRHIANGGTWTRRYDMHTKSNRLRRINTDKPLESTTYSYDGHGNMLNVAKVAPGQRLRWDYRDMIGSLNLGAGQNWVYYQYDADKQRSRKHIERTINNVTTIEERIYIDGYERYRRWVGKTLIEEIESHHLFEGEQRVLLMDNVIHSAKSPTQNPLLFRYQYSNHLGSACLELDHLADIVSYEEYHPYGTSAYRAMKKGIEVPAKRYRYTGMERDEESGLSYHTARYYAPWLGRWMSADPIGLEGGSNFYCYSENNPNSLRDISGTQPSSVPRNEKEAEALLKKMEEQKKQLDQWIDKNDKNAGLTPEQRNVQKSLALDDKVSSVINTSLIPLVIGIRLTLGVVDPSGIVESKLDEVDRNLGLGDTGGGAAGRLVLSTISIMAKPQKLISNMLLKPGKAAGVNRSASLLHSLNAEKTGIAHLDRLAVDTPEFIGWEKALGKKSWTVKPANLESGVMAIAEVTDDGKKLIHMDLTQATYLALLHESVHINQVELLMRANVKVSPVLKPGLLSAVEAGAYKYERAVVNKYSSPTPGSRAFDSMPQNNRALTNVYSQELDDTIKSYRRHGKYDEGVLKNALSQKNPKSAYRLH